MMVNGTPQHTRRPRPYGLSVLPRLAKNPPEFFLETLHERGDLVELNLGPARLLLVHHPDHVRHVLQENWRTYGKGSMWVAIRKLVGNGLLGSEGQHWLQQRRLMQPAFHRQKLAALASTMTTTIAAMLDDWNSAARADKPVEVAQAMADLTMQIIVRTMFGASIDSAETRDLGQAFARALRLMNVRMWTFFLPDSIPLPGDRAFREAINHIDSAVYRFIAQRRQNPTTENDLLNLLLEARDEETGAHMTDQQVRDEVFTIFLAGHETTATVMSWVWYVLDQYPDVQRRLHAELDSVLVGRLPTLESLSRLNYTRMLIEETMRFYPPSWMIPRSVEADDTIGALPVKKGTTVLISPYVVHRHPDFWENPTTFDPERFAAGQNVPRHAYIPFGEGPRLCIGNNFAMMEMQIILAMVAQAFRLSLQPGINIRPTTMPVLRPNQPLHMNLQVRTRPVSNATWLMATETGEYQLVPEHERIDTDRD